MGPQALQAGQHVAVLGQLHLCLGTGCLGAHGKDVEDEAGAVEDFHLQLLFYVAQLLGAELVIKDDHAHLALGFLLLLDILSYLLQFAYSQISDAAWPRQPLGEPLHSDGSGCGGEKLQFVQIFVGLAFVLLGRDDAHEDGRLVVRLGNHLRVAVVLELSHRPPFISLESPDSGLRPRICWDW